MKLVLGLLFAIAGIFSIFYISIWWGIVQPILALTGAYDAHTLTGAVIAGALVKFVVGVFFFFISAVCLSD